jgi:hypothetical protein
MYMMLSGSKSLFRIGTFLLALLVGGQAAAQAPVFTSATRADYQVGIPGTFTVATSSATTAAITIQGPLPAGLYFYDAGNGTATINGNPQRGTQGGIVVVLTAVNGDGSTTQNLLVYVSKAAEVVSNDYATFVAGSESTFSVYSDADPVGTVTVTGSVPAGLTLQDIGFGRVILSGTPTAGSIGVYTFNVVATNSLGSDTQTLTVTVLSATPTTSDRNYSGMYYNPASSGYAVNLTHQGNVLVAAWYTFAQSGRPIWFTAATTRQPDGSFAGDYTVYTGLPFNEINNAPATLTSASAGTVSLSFAPDGKLDFRFVANEFAGSQQRTLTKLQFDAAAPSCHFTNLSRNTASNYTDLWWQPLESGWGLTIEHQGNRIYVAWYTYAADGQPVWMTALLSLQSDGSYAGAINRPNNGIWYVYDVNGPVTSFPLPEIGSATLRFSDGEHGSFSYVIGAVNQTKPIERIVFASPVQVCST